MLTNERQSTTMAAMDDFEEEWYYETKDEQEVGPVSKEELHAAFARGDFDVACLVWEESMADWTPAQDVPDLVAFLRGSDPSAATVASASSSYAAAAVEAQVAAAAADEAAQQRRQAQMRDEKRHRETKLLMSLLLKQTGASAATMRESLTKFCAEQRSVRA